MLVQFRTLISLRAFLIFEFAASESVWMSKNFLLRTISEYKRIWASRFHLYNHYNIMNFNADKSF